MVIIPHRRKGKTGTLALNRFFVDTQKYAAYAFYTAKAEIKSRVNSSYLNWIWLILEPFCFMLIYAFIVRIIFRSNEPYFPAFVFIGLSAWNFFTRTISASTNIVKSYKGIIIRTYIPKYVLLYTRILRNGFDASISFIIAFILMIGYKVPFTWNILSFFPLLILLFLITFSISTIVLHFGTFIDDLSKVVAILMRLLFYMSGIFYSVATRVPAPYGALLSHYNPAAFIINEMRNVLLFNTPLNLKWYCIWFAISIIVSAIGIYLIYKHESKYAKVI